MTLIICIALIAAILIVVGWTCIAYGAGVNEQMNKPDEE